MKPATALSIPMSLPLRRLPLILPLITVLGSYLAILQDDGNNPGAQRPPASHAAVQAAGTPGLPAAVTGPSSAAVKPSVWQNTMSHPDMEAFRQWAMAYAAAPVSTRRGMEATGTALAASRQRILAGMIVASPELALQHAIPAHLRALMPPSVAALLEESVNTRAGYRVLCAKPTPDRKDDHAPLVREADIHGVRHAVFTWGRGLDFLTRSSVPVNGITLPAVAHVNPLPAPDGHPERLMALDPSPARVLEASEVAAWQATAGPQQCEATGAPLTVTAATPVLAFGGEMHAFSSAAAMEQWAASATGTAALDQPETGSLPVAASGYTEGTKRFLFLRVRFSDSSSAEADTIPLGNAQGLMAGMVSHMAEISYDRLNIAPLGEGGSAITEPLLINATAASYNDAGLSRLYPDARAAAAAAGYNLNDYQFFAVFTRGRPSAGYAGLAYVGGIGIHIANGYWGRNVLVHELGHNLGLPHAHTWNTSNNSIIGDGTNVEYGNGYDPMGSGGDNDHYVGSYKRALDYIPGNDGNAVTAPGIYRLYAQDNIFGNQGLRTLRVSRNGSQDYSFDYRGDRGEAEFQNGLFTHFCNKDGKQSYLLDCTPRQNNIAQPIGLTFTDPTAGVHVTPLRKTATWPASMDVAVYFNTAGNRPPAGTLTCHSPQVPAGTPVLFTVSASDPDGDELAYSWDFGDGTYSMDNSPSQTHTFAADGEYAVQCTVSDLRGGVWRKTVVVQAGAPVAGQYHITGRVMDAANRPLSGIRVYTDDTRYAWTDSDGSYFLARIPAGSTTVKAREMVENKLSFSRVFPDPLTLNAHYSGADFSISSTPPEILTTLVAKNAVWKYHDTGTDLGTTWRAAAYADTAWASGPGMLGYGNGGEGTVVSFGPDASNKRTTCYFRKSFTVANPAAFQELRLQCQRDDMVLVYLNGTLIFSDNLPDNVTPETVVYTTRAKDAVEPDGYLTTLNINPSLLVAGTNVLAAEVHQVEPTSSDLAFDAALTGVAQAPSTGAAAAYLTYPADGATLIAPLPSLTITGEARATGATVTKMAFYSNGQLLGEDITAPYQWPWTPPASGSHTLHSITTFSTGTTLTSPTVTFSIRSAPQQLIPPGASWKYFASKTTTPPANWFSPAYTDNWPSGTAQLGYGDGDEATVMSGGPYPSVFLRHSFHVSDPASVTGLLARLIRDDAAVVYLNGTLVWRSNFTEVSGTWTPQAAGAESIENAWHTQPLDPLLLVPGNNLLAVEVQQNAPASSDLSFDFSLEASGTAGRASGVYLSAPAAVLLPSAANLTADAVLSTGRNPVKVEYYNGAVKLGEDTTWPFAFTWTNPPPGSHSVTARLTDSSSATSVSSPVTVTVQQPARATALVSFFESWKYLDTGVDPGSNWQGRTSFDDSSWPEGRGRLGYGGDGEITPLNPGNPASRPITVWFRKKFTTPDPAAFSALRLRILRDDAVAVYLNRTELVRDHLPEGTLSFATLATESVGGTDEQTAVDFIVPASALRAGENQLAVEVHQSAANSSDLGFDFALYGLSSPTVTTPSVWLTSPASGEQLHPAQGISFASAFSGNPAVTEVEYFAGAAKVGETTSAPWNLTWSLPLNGTYTVKARATLTGGSTLESTAIPVTVGAPEQTMTLVARGADWKYLDTGVAPAANWQTAAFNDSAWLSGPARLGFGGDGESTVMTSGRLVYWARKSFTVPAGMSPVSATMRVQRDDGVAVYLDGTRLAKLNINDEPVRFDSAAASTIGDAAEQEWVDVVVPPAALTPGTHQLAVSIHQTTTGSSDTGFDMEFSAAFRPAIGLFNSQPAAPPGLTLLPRSGSALLDLTLQDQAGRVYLIEQSSSLLGWTPYSTHIMTGSSLTIPLTRGTEPRRYYRARWLANP